MTARRSWYRLGLGLAVAALMGTACTSGGSDSGGDAPGKAAGIATVALQANTVPNPSTVVLKLGAAYSQQWFTYNQLGQITPMPMAWNGTAAGTKGTCHLPLTDRIPADT
jgi:hypothetical protein